MSLCVSSGPSACPAHRKFQHLACGSSWKSTSRYEGLLWRSRCFPHICCLSLGLVDSSCSLSAKGSWDGPKFPQLPGIGLGESAAPLAESLPWAMMKTSECGAKGQCNIWHSSVPEERLALVPGFQAGSKWADWRPKPRQGSSKWVLKQHRQDSEWNIRRAGRWIVRGKQVCESGAIDKLKLGLTISYL